MYSSIQVGFLLLFRFRFGFQFQFPVPLRFAAHWCNKSQDNLATIIMALFVIWLRRLLWLLQGLIHTHTHCGQAIVQIVHPRVSKSIECIVKMQFQYLISSCAPNCRVMWATFPSSHHHDNLMSTCLFAIWILVWVHAWMPLWVSFVHS